MLFLSFQKDQNIIKIQQDEFILEWGEDIIHHPTEGRWSIGQTERHHCILIRARACSESSLWNVLFANANMMITHPEIKLREDLSPFQLLKQLINVGKWILVFDRLLIQWTVIDIESFRTILLLDEKNSTTPRRRAWSDQAQTLLLIKLFLSSFSSSGPNLYDRLHTVSLPRSSSITNSTAQCGGIPGSSSGKTSSYSQTSGTCKIGEISPFSFKENRRTVSSRAAKIITSSKE